MQIDLEGGWCGYFPKHTRFEEWAVVTSVSVVLFGYCKRKPFLS